MPFIMPAVCCCCRDCFSISVFQSFMSVACACSASLSTAMSPRKHKIWEESSVTAAKRPARSSSNAPCNMSTVSTDGPLRAASSKRRMTSRSSSSILSKAVLSRVLTSRKNMLYHCARSTTVRSPLPSPSAGAPGAGDAGGASDGAGVSDAADAESDSLAFTGRAGGVGAESRGLRAGGQAETPPASPFFGLRLRPSIAAPSYSSSASSDSSSAKAAAGASQQRGLGRAGGRGAAERAAAAKEGRGRRQGVARTIVGRPAGQRRAEALCEADASFVVHARPAVAKGFPGSRCAGRETVLQPTGPHASAPSQGERPTSNLRQRPRHRPHPAVLPGARAAPAGRTAAAATACDQGEAGPQHPQGAASLRVQRIRGRAGGLLEVLRRYVFGDRLQWPTLGQRIDRGREEPAERADQEVRPGIFVLALHVVL
mmetsp:Transcript_95825/g.310547  ORF Transcript_95825/g.310547 Transcript_95825/m.310547 type:complete len:428 (-) Transcript_95825:878-2161(-)